MIQSYFLGALTALCMLLAMPAQAQDIPARSPLGIDYMALTEGDAQLAAILLAGEKEWMQSRATDEFGSDAGVEFEDNASLLKKEKVTKGMLRDLMQFTPQMVLSFIELPKERYPLLQEIGGLAEAEERYAKAKERNAEAKERNAEAKERNAEAEERLKRAQAIAGALGVRK